MNKNEINIICEIIFNIFENVVQYNDKNINIDQRIRYRYNMRRVDFFTRYNVRMNEKYKRKIRNIKNVMCDMFNNNMQEIFKEFNHILFFISMVVPLMFVCDIIIFLAAMIMYAMQNEKQ